MRAPFSSCWRLALGALCLAAVTLTPAPAAEEAWRLGEAIGAPGRLKVGGAFRARYETIHDPFLVVPTASDRFLALRLLFGARFDFDRFYLGAELQDSRAYLTEAGPPLGTDDVNAVELLRAYVGYRREDVFTAGDRLDVHAGRVTIDVGSRRLVARNRFRNTINAFSGIHGTWSGPSGTTAQAFYAFPVQRLPFDFERLERNSVVFDEESSRVRFWGVHGSRPRLFAGVSGEVYVFRIDEDDRTKVPTRNRNLYTPGFRLLSEPAAGPWRFEIEAVLQIGESRGTPLPTDVDDLDHRAYFAHAHLVRDLDGAGHLRLLLQYDYASGDRDPYDGDNERFDTLYGARRFEFGPTGIYGAIARSNVNTPGLRLEIDPDDRIDAIVGYRALFLASDRDFWTTAGIRDPTGESGSFVGHQLEAAARYALLPDSLLIEAGGATLIRGEFLRNAPTSPPGGDTRYFYTQMTWIF